MVMLYNASFSPQSLEHWYYPQVVESGLNIMFGLYKEIASILLILEKPSSL